MGNLKKLGSQSWQDLAPRGTQFHPEALDAYVSRIKWTNKYPNIPEDVLAQWIYPHHQNEQTLKNYSWMDYYKVSFQIERWEFPELKAVKLINLYENTQSEIDSPFNAVSAIWEDYQFWTDKGTWRVPPIILDCESIKNAPKNAEIKLPYQLVEGHSRMRNLLIAQCKGKIKLAENHKIYLMKSG